MSNGTTSDTYKYNADGLRTQKTVNGVTTTYYLEGDQIAWQTDGTNTIHYVYDNSGNPVYMLLNGSIYYYERNAQNDIIGLVDSSMNEVVTYSYDTWGKLLSIGGSMASTVGTLNPFRYRGYYYDTETGLYYLQIRYYDPSLGRFINADGAISSGTGLLGYNMFAYCNNNPVMMSDADAIRPIVGADPISETPTELAESLAAAKAAAKVNAPSNSRSLSLTGEPNSKVKSPDGKQEREYGPDGKAKRDTDYGHANHHQELKSPHHHDWDWTQPPGKERGPAYNFTQNELYWDRPAQEFISSFSGHISEITGLTGTALVVYLILSEGLCVIPARNLVPVP